ncbi:hypothetical protein VNO77_37286 [Canavalia gladiata]|uniref:Uncharacterized protein n=1 Tax=Canavalia gladiata TaxID=3824 RepID=A0AAN9KBY3_CANGL
MHLIEKEKKHPLIPAQDFMQAYSVEQGMVFGIGFTQIIRLRTKTHLRLRASREENSFKTHLSASKCILDESYLLCFLLMIDNDPSKSLLFPTIGLSIKREYQFLVPDTWNQLYEALVNWDSTRELVIIAQRPIRVISSFVTVREDLSHLYPNKV